ncbi:MAG: hypothetical protein LAO51_13140 [Acidobacteriia bacterium]|nr:hypothetical protein [Terriglobia bacterium]
MKRGSFASSLALACGALLLVGGDATAMAAGAGPGTAPPKGPVLGVLVDEAAVDALPAPPALDRPLGARVVARWSEIETEKGVYDWSRLEPAVAKLSGAGFRVALCLTGSNPVYLADGSAPSPLTGDSVQAWTNFVRSAVRSFAGRVKVFEIWDGPATPLPDRQGPAFDPQVYAYVLKSSALAVRAEAREANAEALVAEGAIAAADVEWQKGLWLQDAAAYIDILPVRIPSGAGDVGQDLGSVFREAVQHPPAPEFWAYAEIAEGSPADEPIACAVQAVSAVAPAAVALARVSGDAAQVVRQAKVLYGLEQALSGFAAAPRGQLSFLDDHQVPVSGARVIGRFLNDAEDDFPTEIVYDSPTPGLAGGQAWLVTDVPDVRDAKVVDPLTGGSVETVPSRVPNQPGSRALRVVFAAHPMVLSFRKAPLPKGLELPTEQLKVESSRGLTAEEIIARYQAVQKLQDDRLDRWKAAARIDYHFKIAQAGTAVDVAIDSTYFWERGGQLEWDQSTYYVNGNKVTWKTIPELPLIQPEKVITLPLDLTLDKTYLYRLRGEDTVDGRPAYVLEFEPANPGVKTSLYHGRVWVDRETFVRIKASLIETNLEPPVVSNEETDVFKPFLGPDGVQYWMLSRIDGEQLWTVGGRNFVVNRQVDFATYDLNLAKPALEEARKSAYASKDLMLRDTDKGYRYLDRQADGTRKVKESVVTRKWFAAAGAYKDSSRSSPVPLAGVNYLDYDMFHKNIQFNVLFAGVLAFVNMTQPSLFGSRIDLTGEAVGVALKGEDKVYDGDVEQVDRRIDIRDQYASVRLGIPAGSFVKFTLIGSFFYEQYASNSDANKALRAENAANGTALRFVLPQDQVQTDGTLQVEFNRKGYGVAASGTWSRRSKWEPWGLFDDTTQAFVSPEPVNKTFTEWDLTGTKEWYLPKFQKVRAEVNYMDGRDLDRFSRYSFSLFGQDHLPGFAGTGVRFDRGLVGRTGYSFNLFGAIRFDVSLERARVLDRSATAGYQVFTGAGLSGNIIGPWQTVIAASYGRAVQSDIPQLVGKQQFLFTILKLF